MILKTVLYVDQTIFIALNILDHPAHEQAVEGVRGILSSNQRLATSSLEIGIGLEAVYRQAGAERAQRFLSLLREAQIEILPINREILEDAQKLLQEKWDNEQEVTFLNCVRVSTTKHYKIHHILSLDKELSKFSLIRLPK